MGVGEVVVEAVARGRRRGASPLATGAEAEGGVGGACHVRVGGLECDAAPSLGDVVEPRVGPESAPAVAAPERGVAATIE